MSDKNSHENTKALEEKLAALEADFQAFVYAVSHDVASPLRHIEGFTRRVLKRHEGKLDEDTAHDLGIVMKSVGKCQQDLAALQTYSRLSTKFKARDGVDIDAILTSVLAENAERIAGKQAEIKVEPLTPVYADPNQIKLLFTCLIDNTLKYSREVSAPLIQIHAHLEGDVQHISICDNGIGIDEKYHDKVFVMFRRAVVPNDYPGQGCGLTYAKRIVALHGGKITLQSKKGGGATISFTLPLHKASDS